MTKPVIIVHGGAGDWPKSKQSAGLTGVRMAAAEGYKLLEQRGSALRAIEAAVKMMENNPTFNAGTGATLNLAGEVEADAGIMDGRTRRGAGVALVRHVKNPVGLARIVLSKTDHALIAGKTAEKLAETFKLPTANLKDPDRVRQWKEATRNLGRKTFRYFPKNLKLLTQNGQSFLGDTVGALAIDHKGDLAAADSTGGVFLKLPGRIGDSPILGAGLYADNKTGAATATGIGEIAMRMVVSKYACDAMASTTAQQAADRTVKHVTESVGKGLGIITLDRKGRFGVAHNTPHICWALYNEEGGLVSRMRR